MKIIFHIHTKNSKCSNLSITEIVNFCHTNNIKKVFITDHNRLTLPKNTKDIEFIPSIEISTNQGDIIGIFINKEIKTGLTIEETCSEIHKQGGLAVAPHPVDMLRGEAIGFKNTIKNINSIDIIEVFNSRNLLNVSNNKARNIANKYKKAIISGSDAHEYRELGNCIIDIEDFKDAEDYMKVLLKANYLLKKSGVIPHINSIKSKYLN